MSESEVPEEPEEVDDIPYIKGMQTLQVHKVQRFINIAGFFSQILLSCLWPGSILHSEPCGHFDIPVQFNSYSTCAKCLQEETGSDW